MGRGHVKRASYTPEGSGAETRFSDANHSGVRYDSNNSLRLRMAFAQGYHVDDEGRLWSYTGNQLHPGPDSNGYPRFTVNMGKVNGKRILRSLVVHRLVALQKYGDAIYTPGIQIRHLDGNPLNFRPDNIDIGTSHENALDRPRTERLAHGKHAARALRVLTPAQARSLLRLRRKYGLSENLLKVLFGVSKSTVSYLINGRTYPELARRPEALHA